MNPTQEMMRAKGRQKSISHRSLNRWHTFLAALLVALLALHIPLSTESDRPFIKIFATASTINPANNDPDALGAQMAQQYTQQLNLIVQLMDEPLNNSNSQKQLFNKGQQAFNKAIQIFPDETSLPHAHALFAKLCVKLEYYEKSLELFDEAIRRASIPLEKDSNNEDIDDDDDDSTPPSQEAIEAQSLVKQLILERNRAHYSHLQTSLNKWDSANHALHGGGIPDETSPLDPLGVVQHMLRVFPNPHPQALFDKATFLVLLLDSPVPNDNGDYNRTAKAWEAYEVYTQSQTWGFGAYTHGKKRGLAGGKPCGGKDYGFGMAVGGLAYSNYALESYPYQPTSGDDSKTFNGVVTLQNVIVSGKDAVISGYGENCQVFVPHRYVNLADNIPMVTSWESSVHELTMGDNSMWLTYIPSNDVKAYGGKIGKDAEGNDVLKIPDPKPKSTSKGFDTAVLLTGYASNNFYHFVSEVLPSLIMMKDRVNEALTKSSPETKGKAKDVIIVPSLQHEFVEGFLQLLLPNAFTDSVPSKHIVQWGPAKRPSNTTLPSKFSTLHPITYVRRLYAAVWDQPKEAPEPVSGAAHCLTPSPLLKAMRQAVWDAVEARGGAIHAKKKGSRIRVVYCPRASSATRSLKEEQELLSSIKETVAGLGGEVVVFEKVAKDDLNSTLSSSELSPLGFVMESVELFRSASIVIGVHGASLANIAFSEPGTTVIEMGFEGLPQASHYRHLSNALGFKHVNVWLERDARSLGATQVKLRPGGMKVVVDAVIDGFNDASRGHVEL